MENLKAVLTEEGLVSFECKVVGFPTPLLRWFKDGQELKPGDVYQLTGTNSLGKQSLNICYIFSFFLLFYYAFTYFVDNIQVPIAVSREIAWVRPRVQLN